MTVRRAVEYDPANWTREDVYEERIAHLRSALELIGEDYSHLLERVSGAPARSHRTVLDQDMDRSVAQDRLPR